MKILFLDIDGVLNDHGQMMNLYCGIHRDKVDLLNEVIDATDCYIVISSAWRYMMLGGEMTVQGFEYMLLSHGLKCHNRIIGHTPSDEDVDTRGKQITEWINIILPEVLQEKGISSYKAVVVDDLDKEKGIQITESGHVLVQTNGKIGLTDENVNRIIEILNS